jgi:hypothetical protein
MGNIFELSSGQNGRTYTDLHSFVRGANPQAGVTVAPDGILYGVGSSAAWKITR